jgi:L,D-transpeptidase ErfK/SrfK
LLLPNDLQVGITINLAELRLYLLWDENGTRKIRVYPVGIGQDGWETPRGVFLVKILIANPDWTPPASLREEKLDLPGIVPSGPDNPLGSYWIGLSAEGVGIHGTNQPFGVGRQVSHGCIRLYEQDIADLVDRVRPGTRVWIIDQPVKYAMGNGELYLEVHRKVEQFAGSGVRPEDWNPEVLARTLQEARGIPVGIQRKNNISVAY